MIYDLEYLNEGSTQQILLMLEYEQRLLDMMKKDIAQLESRLQNLTESTKYSEDKIKVLRDILKSRSIERDGW